MLQERKQVMRDEIREGLAHLREESYEALLSDTSDAGDESLAPLITDVTNAEVARDVAELQDINAAESRLTVGTYGNCVDCEKPIPYARLHDVKFSVPTAHPALKHCRAEFIRPTLLEATFLVE